MELVNRFSIDAPVDIAWKGLMDIPLVVDCLPGATLTETISPTSYKGKIRVRLGPIAMEFAGALTLEIANGTPHVATINANWNETKNRGSASSVSRLMVTPTGEAADRSDIDVHTDVQLAGQVAQYGRGVGIINSVANELVRQFAENLHVAFARLTVANQPSAMNNLPVGAQSQESTLEAARVPVVRERSKEISTLSLLWAVIKAKIRALLARP
jgi:carbon monoxide dehydrogenase subunit G